jgi:hypothetical protein
MKNKVLPYLGQALCYGLLMLALGFWSNSPPYRHLPADMATIKLSLRHSGQVLGECRQRSAEELAALPANMRLAEVCPRERSPLLLEMDLDGVTVFSELLPARGLHNDGMASVYRRLSVPAGETRLRLRLKDHIELGEFNYRAERTVTLAPAQVLVVDFDSQAGQFVFL